MLEHFLFSLFKELKKQFTLYSKYTKQDILYKKGVNDGVLLQTSLCIQVYLHVYLL